MLRPEVLGEGVLGEVSVGVFGGVFVAVFIGILGGANKPDCVTIPLSFKVTAFKISVVSILTKVRFDIVRGITIRKRALCRGAEVCYI
jgi:hypothetical protein